MNQEIIEHLTAWAERHAEDPEDYALGAFLTVGELRELLKALKTNTLTDILLSEYGDWRGVDDPEIEQFAMGGDGRCVQCFAWRH